MLAKLMLTALIIGVVWLFFMRTARKRREPRRIKSKETLIRCSSCGAFYVDGSTCPCIRPG